jgi:hypothetical protein
VSLQLRNTLRQLEELTEQNLTLKHALDFSLARQEALIQRQEEMELRSMHSQRVRSWVAESNSRLSQHDKGHGKSDLDKVSAVAKTTIVPRTSTLTKHVDNESVRTAAEHAGDSVPERPVVQTSRSHSDYKIPKYSGDGYVDTYLTQFQLTARAAGYPRAEWGYRLCAALEGKARGILTQDILNCEPSFEEIAALLRGRFASESSPELWQQQLEGRRRGAKESIAELQQWIRDATMKAFPTMEFANRSRLAAGYFNNTLGDEDQRLYVRTHAPKSLEEAAKVALAYENAQRIDAQRHAPNPAPRSGRQVRAVDEPHEQPSGAR